MRVLAVFYHRLKDEVSVDTVDILLISVTRSHLFNLFSCMDHSRFETFHLRIKEPFLVEDDASSPL